jgi:ABC-type lipoprotein release transport system permease subunit
VLIPLAWRNLWRNRTRSLLTAGGMVVGLTLMIAYLALIEGMFRQMVGFATQVTVGNLQVHRQEFIDNQDLYAVLPVALMEQLEGTTPYRYAPRAYAAGLASAGDHSSGAMLRGIDPEREARVTELHRRIRLGRFSLEGAGQAFPRGKGGEPVPVYPVVIGFNLAKNLGLEPGGEIVLITQAADGSIGNGLFQVRGVLNSLDPAFDRMGVLMSLEAFNSLMVLGDGVHELAVAIPDPDAQAEAKVQIVATVRHWPGLAALESDGGGPVRTRTWQEINPALHDMIVSSQGAIYIVAGIVFVIAAMGILNTLLMAVYERRHELGILRALGMGRAALMGMVMLEAFFLACFGALVGTLSGVALAWYLQVEGWDYSRWLPEGLDMMGVVVDPIFRAYLRPEHIWMGVAMMFGTALLAALLPSWRTARLDPTRVLHP